MDILTDILTTSGLKKRLLHHRLLYRPWALLFPCPQSIGFHVVTQGVAYLWTSSKDPIQLKQGDIAFMARGTHHHISTHAEAKLLESAQSVIGFENTEEPGKALSGLVSGAYQFWHDPLHPIFHELPQWLVIRREDVSLSDPLQNCLQILNQELLRQTQASEAVIGSLLDVMFHLIFRRILSSHKARQHWGEATADPAISMALTLMHKTPDKNWSVQQLAQEVGMSRSGFAARFKSLLSDTPLHYLTTLRMSKAMFALSQSDDTLEAIAHSVGYRDAFGFSKSFKKTVGLSPSEFRKKNTAERDLAWRF